MSPRRESPLWVPALELNPTAYSGIGAETKAFVARNTPFFDDRIGENTTEFKNLVLGQALESMKSIFGSNPTEGERAILMELQAVPSLSVPERDRLLKRAQALIDRRLQFARERADALWNGPSFREGAGPRAPESLASAGLIAQAREAISRGASRDAVITRLRERGFEVEGL